MRVTISRTSPVAIGIESSVAIGFEGTKDVSAQLDIEAFDAVSLLISILESDDGVQWIPSGVSQTVVAVGQVAMAVASVTRRLVKLDCILTGNQGQTALVQATLDVKEQHNAQGNQ